MKKIFYALFISLMVSMAVTAYSDGIQEDLQSNLVRLHIIANSDSDEDQAVKLKIRDAVLAETEKELEISTKEEIVKNLDKFEEIANGVLAENGFPYTAHALYGKFDFPKKEYKNITLPAGEYFGVRLILGEGEGHNWWCVMYPPLCVADDSSMEMDGKSQELLKQSLDEETYEVVTGEKSDITVKFKAVELIQELKQKIKNK